ncbi:hypothetical protein 2 [Hubei picorna-like virus 66]|uniref:hypothetical protein 2 n=1 Tax=Hubei picorna-like virus 66 TaxID=1923149 RepID=UPI00090A157F|nr:hypothetical protein 2 [Hubei picorna-like virus 66]APG77451.1 hypothetical protein 2 [Hubei picorna-like virus 66]
MDFTLPLMKIVGPKSTVTLLLLLQAACLYFNTHNTLVFGSLWCIYFSYLYTVYFGEWMLKHIDNLFDKIVSRFRGAIVESATIVRDQLQETSVSLSGGTTLSGIMNNFAKHKVGVTLCAKTAITATTPGQVIEETVKTASMLGLEHSVINAALGKLSALSSEVITGALNGNLNEHGIEDIENLIPLASAVAAMADHEFTDFQLNGKMDKIAKNIKNAETIVQTFRKCAETAGVLKPKNWGLLEELSTITTGLRDDFEWMVTLLATQGAEFTKAPVYDRVRKFKEKVKLARTRFKQVDIPSIRNNQIVTECNSVLSKCEDYFNQIEIIRANSGSRVVPVGICIKGDSHIGKSTLVPLLCEKVKARLHKDRAIVGDSTMWSRWDANQREEFDSGYCGQEIVYMDDAFQDKTNKDHLMWYTYISPTCVGTLQGIAEQKGLPFRAVMCLTTCNSFPTTSVAVSCITALHNRFPITITATKREGISIKKTYDPQFSHLKFNVNTMVEAVAGKEGDEMTLDQVADMIAARIVNEHIVHMDHVKAIRNIPVIENGEEDGEEIDELSDLWSFIDSKANVLETIREEGDVDEEPVVFDNTDETEVAIAAFIGEEYTRLNAVTQSFVVDEADWITMGDKAIEALQTLLRAEENYHSIEHVGPWTDWLERKEGDRMVEFDPSLYRQEDGLFSFLNSLGSWQIKSDATKIFYEEFFKQPPLSVEGAFGGQYIWAPYLSGGKSLILLDPDSRQIVLEKLLPWWRKHRTCKLRAKALVLKLYNHPFGRSFFRHMALIPTYSLLPHFPLMHQAHITSLFGYAWGRVPFVFRLEGYSRWRLLGLNTMHVINWPVLVMSRGFDYLDQIVRRLTSGLRGIVIKCLEYLGINVTEFWREIADLSVRLVNDSITAVLASVIVYLLWKLFNVLFRKNPPLKEHSYGGHAQKAKAERNRKYQQRKKLKLRSLTAHGEEEALVCEDECPEEDLCVEKDGEVWHKIGKCNQKDSIYDPMFLTFIVEQSEYFDEGAAYKADVVCLQNTHCSIRLSEADDFTVEETKFVKAFKRSDVQNSKEVLIFEMEMDICDNDYESKYKQILANFKEKKICDWRAEVFVRIVDKVMLKIKLECLTTTIQGSPGRFVHNNLKDLKEIAEDLKGIKARSDVTFEQVLTVHGQEDAIELVNFITDNHQVWMSRVPLEELDSERYGKSTHGLGHKDYIIFNAHNYVMGDIVRFWRFKNKGERLYNVCKVVYLNKVRDVGIAKIMSQKELKDHLISKQVFMPVVNVSSVKEVFRSLETKVTTGEIWKELTSDQTCLSFLPMSKGFSKGRVNVLGVRSYLINEEQQSREYLEVSQLGITNDLARPGDCGGVIVSCNDRKTNKIIGFHAGAFGRNWVAAILTREDLAIVEQHGNEDGWLKLVVEGEPTDLPKGPCVKFIGKYKTTTRPTNPQSINRWKAAPWAEQFEEQLQPAPLDADDERILVELPTNMKGKKSLLLDKNSKMCEQLPMMDSSILKTCIDHISKEMALKIGHIHKVGDDLDKVIEIGLNGHPDNQHVKAIDDRKSCGEPWCQLNNCLKKSDFLDNNDGYLTLKKDMAGSCLETRIKRKLLGAQKSERNMSFYVSKLKDELLKISKVQSGGTRVFANVPIDKIICDAALFGNFKEAYCRNFINLNHAVGVNPHGLGWKLIKQHLDKHPNCFDLDFGNFDKRLSETLLHGAFEIIRRVIQIRAPDNWDEARRILENESINSYMIDYDTVYMTERGNKSGEYLTTVINCICNDVLSYYSWICTVGIEDLAVFRDNVSIITFGDDKCESVSDRYASQYNYFTVKEVMKLIGHEITPGNKDGVERDFCGIDQLQFLKRTFVDRDDMVVAPLLQRSIESPFVWTQTPSSDHTVWKNLIEASLYEAQLHGEEYYNEFLEKMRRCDDDDLLSHVSTVLCNTFEEIKQKYSDVWHGNNVHLDE